jgi:hypothetical protein
LERAAVPAVGIVKLVESLVAFVLLASIRSWIKFVHTT